MRMVFVLMAEGTLSCLAIVVDDNEDEGVTNYEVPYICIGLRTQFPHNVSSDVEIKADLQTKGSKAHAKS